MSDLIFNLRIWAFHFQISKGCYIKPMFAWYDFWIGLFFDTKKSITYIFPLPMFGFKIWGFRIAYNKSYKIFKHPFIKLFNFGKNYYPYKHYNP